MRVTVSRSGDASAKATREAFHPAHIIHGIRCRSFCSGGTSDRQGLETCQNIYVCEARRITHDGSGNQAPLGGKFTRTRPRGENCGAFQTVSYARRLCVCLRSSAGLAAAPLQPCCLYTNASKANGSINFYTSGVALLCFPTSPTQRINSYLW